MSSDISATGEYKLVLSSIYSGSENTAAKELSKLLGIEIKGAELIMKAVPIILLEGLSQEQATQANYNTKDLQEAGAQVQIVKGPVGKLRKATWPEIAFPKIFKRVTSTAPPSDVSIPLVGSPDPNTVHASLEAPAKEPGDKVSTDVDFSSIDVNKSADEEDDVIDNLSTEEMWADFSANAAAQAEIIDASTETKEISEEDIRAYQSQGSHPPAFFSCPHCGITYEMRAISRQHKSDSKIDTEDAGSSAPDSLASTPIAVSPKQQNVFTHSLSETLNELEKAASSPDDFIETMIDEPSDSLHSEKEEEKESSSEAKK